MNDDIITIALRQINYKSFRYKLYYDSINKKLTVFYTLMVKKDRDLKELFEISNLDHVFCWDKNKKKLRINNNQIESGSAFYDSCTNVMLSFTKRYNREDLLDCPSVSDFLYSEWKKITQDERIRSASKDLEKASARWQALTSGEDPEPKTKIRVKVKSNYDNLPF